MWRRAEPAFRCEISNPLPSRHGGAAINRSGQATTLDGMARLDEGDVARPEPRLTRPDRLDVT